MVNISDSLVPPLHLAKPGDSRAALTTVPFNRPAFLGPEMEEMKNAIINNKHISGVGPYTEFCESLLSRLYNAPVLLVTSCTHALEMAAFLLNLSPGDEVIVPSFTFVSTANAFVVKGCTIRFADCDEYGQISLESIERQMTDKTRAVCVVHYAGNSTDMDALVAFCKARQLYLVEDAAQAIGSQYQGRLLGTFGDVATLSFHETKNVTCGEGGALIINNPDLLERAYILREKGTNRKQYFEGLVDKYTWVDMGSSYVLSDLNAAYLSVQLKHVDAITQRRAHIHRHYQEALTPMLPDLGARILGTPSWNRPNYHMFALIFDSPDRRKPFIQYMKSCSITAPFHYVALHQSPMGERFHIGNETFPNTEILSQCLVRLPLFYNMTDEQQGLVIDSVRNFIKTS